jgi:UDP-N-acetylglucosamine 4,6-dehydratase
LNAFKSNGHTDGGLDDLSILITGGTGSFGRQFIKTVLRRHRPRRLIVFSRDELKQFEMQQEFSEQQYRCMRYFIGDVRDRDRLYRAFDDVDVVVHAAALKQVPAAEYNPLEAVRTNIMGAANVIDAAIDRNVQRVIALSTDKAVNPINLYGATKLCSDKLFVAANNYAGKHATRFALVRYGNVMGSRGSVIPFFLRKRASGRLPITDERMTRFWLTLEQGVEFVLGRLGQMHGGELFVPKIPSMRIIDLARAIGPECKLDIVGIRPGEKLHEVMVTEDDARHTVELEDRYVILPEHFEVPGYDVAPLCPPEFRYSSDTNIRWLGVDEMRELAGLAHLAEKGELIGASA